MKFKHRIWMLPIMTAVIIMIGIAISSQMTSRTSAALDRVENVQYPTVEALRIVRSAVVDVQESLQRAVAEGDEHAIGAAAEHAIKVRDVLRQLAAVDSESSLASELGESFDDYYSAATAATRIMLGTDSGAAPVAIARMQKTNEALMAHLTRSQDAAIAEFRSLLASGTENVERSLIASLISAGVMLLVLGVGSWVLIGSVFRSLGGEPEVAVQIVRTIATGDFTAVVNLRDGDQSSLLHGIETLRQKLGTLIHDVRTTAGAVDSAATDISTGVDRLSTRTADQAARLEGTASSMEEMTVTVKRNADNARHANLLATEARDQAERGGAVAARAVSAMAEINEASRRIADIIGVIDEIAFQTNLLALNAAVEAARAGEQGRGFAVVASEVRSLAQRSATAAREIKDLIQDSVAKVQDGTKLVDESGQHLTDIVAAAKKVADIIGEISSASQQQASGLDQVSGAITQMDESTQQNAAMAEETSAVAVSMSEQAKKLTDLIAVFRIREDGYRSSGSMIRPVATPAPKPAPVASPRPVVIPAPQPMKKAAGSDVEWQEF
ncbi:MAG TPA: methyl-accepting chemotaxis protein [Steroidobacter sp.]|uniref:methyl-accepting chemotaxis protein n=1 Tax=Steroidobacter sp. TaxID=1978227 RepID=UPI002ED99132